MKMSSHTKTIAGLIIASGITAAANAGSIDLTWSHVGFGGTTNNANVEQVTLDGSSRWVYAGQMNWTLSNGEDFVTYCIELAQGVGATHTYDIYSHDDTAYNALRTDVNFTATTTDRLSAFWAGYNNLVVDNDSAAAFQLGIWNIVYDTDLSLDTGIFTSTSSTATGLANTWLGNLASINLRQDLNAYYNKYQQDQLGPGPSGGITVVPTPAAAGVGVIAMAGLIGRRRRG